jgi:hypothetical protein
MFPDAGSSWPASLLDMDGLIDIRAKVEIEVIAFVPGASQNANRQRR